MTETTANVILAIASDHGGVQLKRALVEWLHENGYGANDFGTQSTDSCDYPDYADALCEWIKEGEGRRGILICGSGIGMSIAANRHPGIRAALVSEGLSARLARQHNDANVLCLGERIVGSEIAKDCVKQFIATAFEGGRHAKRVEKLG